MNIFAAFAAYIVTEIWDSTWTVVEPIRYSVILYAKNSTDSVECHGSVGDCSARNQSASFICREPHSFVAFVSSCVSPVIGFDNRTFLLRLDTSTRTCLVQINSCSFPVTHEVSWECDFGPLPRKFYACVKQQTAAGASGTDSHSTDDVGMENTQKSSKDKYKHTETIAAEEAKKTVFEKESVSEKEPVFEDNAAKIVGEPPKPKDDEMIVDAVDNNTEDATVEMIVEDEPTHSAELLNQQDAASASGSQNSQVSPKKKVAKKGKAAKQQPKPIARSDGTAFLVGEFCDVYYAPKHLRYKVKIVEERKVKGQLKVWVKAVKGGAKWSVSPNDLLKDQEPYRGAPVDSQVDTQYPGEEPNASDDDEIGRDEAGSAHK